MKRFFSILIALVLISGLAIPTRAYAEGTAKITLEKAMEIAKTTFNLKTDGYDFNSSYSEQANGRKVYDLSWNSKKGIQSSFSVGIDGDTGDAVYMYKWTYSSETRSRIPNYTEEQALKAANDIIAKLQPEKSKQVEYKKPYSIYNPSYDLYSDVYSFNFVRKVNGIEFQDNGFNISIDKNTLELRNYNFNWDLDTLQDTSKAIGLDAAKKALKEKAGLELVYNLFQTSDPKNPKPMLVFMQTRGNLPIDAITGEPINYGYPGPMFDRGGMGGASAEYSLSITPEEQKAIDDSSKYITKEKAEEIAKKILSIDEKYKLVNANLYTTYVYGNAVWNLSWQYNDEAAKAFGNIYADIDAVKGEIKDFYMYGSEFEHQKDSKPIYTKETARSVADNLLKQLYPERFSNLEFRDYGNYYYGPGEQPSGYNYSYYRKYNGILCPFDSTSIYVDIYTGKVTNFYSNWTDINLPSSDGTLSLDDAHSTLFDKAKFNLKYMKIYDYSKGTSIPSIKLAYVLDNFSGYMDSKTGTFLDYSGKPVKEFKAPEFTDIKGHAAENNIKLLAQLGVFQDMDDKFMPNGTLLQKDFVKFLVCSLEPVYDYYGSASTDEYDKYYNRALQRKIITEAEKKPDAPVTRQDAAKMFVKALGVGFVANLSGIYNLPFKDSKSIAQSYKGYTAIASELKVVTPIGGYFYPTKQITRGEAATMLVNFMKVNTNPAE